METEAEINIPEISYLVSGQATFEFITQISISFLFNIGNTKAELLKSCCVRWRKIYIGRTHTILKNKYILSAFFKQC